MAWWGWLACVPWSSEPWLEDLRAECNSIPGAEATEVSFTHTVGSWFWLVVGTLAGFSAGILTWSLSMCCGLPHNIEAGFQMWVLRERERARTRASQEEAMLSFMIYQKSHSITSAALFIKAVSKGNLWEVGRLDFTFWLSLEEHLEIGLWPCLENIICRTAPPSLCPTKLKWTLASQGQAFPSPHPLTYPASHSSCLATDLPFSCTPLTRIQCPLPEYKNVLTSFKVNSSETFSLIALASQLDLKSSFPSETCSSFQDWCGALNTWDIDQRRCFLGLGQGPSTGVRGLDTERWPMGGQSKSGGRGKELPFCSPPGLT